MGFSRAEVVVSGTEVTWKGDKSNAAYYTPHFESYLIERA
jgi:hypothetical protein